MIVKQVKLIYVLNLMILLIQISSKNHKTKHSLLIKSRLNLIYLLKRTS